MPVRHRLVSTVIPVFNRPRLLGEAVASVLAQTYRPIEVVIVDDGSTDETAAVGERLAADHPGVVRYLRQANAGWSAARNAGIEAASGEFIQFLDSDDLLLPEKFASQVAALTSNPDCGISYCYTREYKIDGTRSDRPARKTAESFEQLFPAILAGRLWPSPSPLYRRAVVDTNGPFLDVSIYEDWEFECRAGARHVRLHHCRQLLADKRDTHHVEGRQKGGTPRDKLLDYAAIHARILDHARQAGVPARAMNRFSIRLCDVARQCAAAGFEEAARHCHALGRGAATTGWSTFSMAVFAMAADQWGWQRVSGLYLRVSEGPFGRSVSAIRRWPAASFDRWRHRAGRALRYAGRRSREAWPLLRGALILQRYQHHYHRASRAYRRAGLPVSVTAPLRSLGVRAVHPGDRDPLLALPPDFAARVAVVSRGVAAALDEAGKCDLYPAPAPGDGATRTDQIAAVARGEVISIKLRDPLAIAGLVELCDPLIDELERTVYGSHVIVDKVYVYRSPASRQSPGASWLWHFDNHPREMIKVMVYLTDVGEDQAPFEYLCDAEGCPVLGAPLAPLHGDSRVAVDRVERVVAKGGRQVAVTGPAGTVVVFDDNVVHRGTLARVGHRDVVVFQVRPATFRARPRLDPRWTGSFGHLDFNRDPNQLAPTPRHSNAAVSR